jgi:hypothetical protein
LDYVVDDKRSGKEWFGYTVVNMEDFSACGADILIYASFDKNEIDHFSKAQENIKIVALR